MKFIQVLQILVSVALVVLILMQERSSGLSGIFGGDGGSTYQTRRGMEKSIFISTIILSVVFALLAISQLVL